MAYHNAHVVAFFENTLSYFMFMSDDEYETAYMEVKHEEFFSEHQIAPDYSKPDWGISA